jgi:hypothetical protein
LQASSFELKCIAGACGFPFCVSFICASFGDMIFFPTAFAGMTLDSLFASTVAAVAFGFTHIDGSAAAAAAAAAITLAAVPIVIGDVAVKAGL